MPAPSSCLLQRPFINPKYDSRVPANEPIARLDRDPARSGESLLQVSENQSGDAALSLCRDTTLTDKASVPVSLSGFMEVKCN